MVRFKLRDYLEFTGTSILEISKSTGIRYATLYDMFNHNTTKINMIYLQQVMEFLNIKDMNKVFELNVDIDIKEDNAQNWRNIKNLDNISQ